MAEHATVTINLDMDAAEDGLARLEMRAERVERRIVMAINRLERAEAQGRLREVIKDADAQLAAVADDADEETGERIDSVRAMLKDALNV
jgi:hypothetical protein